MPSTFLFCFDEPGSVSSLIALLRRHIQRPMGELRHAIATHEPIAIVAPFPGHYSELVERVATLMDELDAAGVAYRVKVDGKVEPLIYVRNVLQRWRDIGVDVREDAFREAEEE